MLALVVLKLVIVGRTHSPQIDHETKQKKIISLTNKNEEEIKITQRGGSRARILRDDVRRPEAAGDVDVRQAEVVVVVAAPARVAVPVPRRRRGLHGPHEAVDAAWDGDGALVLEPVRLPGLPEQLQHPRVAQARHGHRHPPRRLPALPLHPERRAPLGGRRAVARRRVVPRRGPRQEVGAGAFLPPVRRRPHPLLSPVRLGRLVSPRTRSCGCAARLSFRCLDQESDVRTCALSVRVVYGRTRPGARFRALEWPQAAASDSDA